MSIDMATLPGRSPRRPRSCFLLGLLVLLAGCAGYQIGSESLYPCHIRTVYVPVFTSI
ncbi:hypothetical protein LCGC14_2890190, partial [marine sediment metagenome]